MVSKVDWSQTGTDVLQAVKNVIGGDWELVAAPAGHQIAALIAVAKDIETDYSNHQLDKDDYDMLKAMQKNALEGILTTYKAIGIVVAEQAAAAAWGVVATALKTITGIPFA